MDKLDKAEKRRMYYEANREIIIEKQKIYNEKNKQKIKDREMDNPEVRARKTAAVKKYYHKLKNTDPVKYQLLLADGRKRSKAYRDKKRAEKQAETGVYKPPRRSPRKLTQEEKEERRLEYKKAYQESLAKDPEKAEEHKVKARLRSKKCYYKKKQSKNLVL